jgi:hypothetical protein
MLGDSLNESELTAIKLKEDETLTFGYITRKGSSLSEMGQSFIKKLEAYK